MEIFDVYRLSAMVLMFKGLAPWRAWKGNARRVPWAYLSPPKSKQIVNG